MGTDGGSLKLKTGSWPPNPPHQPGVFEIAALKRDETVTDSAGKSGPGKSLAQGEEKCNSRGRGQDVALLFMPHMPPELVPLAVPKMIAYLRKRR